MKSSREVDAFLRLLMQMEKVLKDFQELSRKKPNDAVNRFKLGLVNTLLETANGVLDESNRPFEAFTTFDEDEMPTNSDAVLILTQYVACLKKHGWDNVVPFNYSKYWVIKGKRSEIEVDSRILKDG